MALRARSTGEWRKTEDSDQINYEYSINNVTDSIRTKFTIPVKSRKYWSWNIFWSTITKQNLINVVQCTMYTEGNQNGFCWLYDIWANGLWRQKHHPNDREASKPTKIGIISSCETHSLFVLLCRHQIWCTVCCVAAKFQYMSSFLFHSHINSVFNFGSNPAFLLFRSLQKSRTVVISDVDATPYLFFYDLWSF